MISQTIMWIIFAILIVAALILDFAICHGKSKEVSIKESILWSLFWIALALLFCVGIYFWHGTQASLAFLAGYFIEKSLSVDNLFVFLLIFTYFKVPRHVQHKALLWGVIGAIAMRAIFIFAGVAIVSKFHWAIYVMGIFLLFTAVKMLFQKDKEIHPEKNPILRLFRKFWPVASEYEGDKFFIKRAGKLLATPLFVVVLVIESTDVIFAVDSIPAIFAITTDPFLVYTSNIFAILGLRAIFFALSGFMILFHHLHYGLSLILAFVGVKMIISNFYKMPIGVALGVIAAVLVTSVVTSILWPPVKK